MTIRLDSPLRETTSDPSRTRTKRSKLSTFFFQTGAGRLLASTLLAWLVAFVYCKYRFWRQPHSWFYNSDAAYDFGYTGYRLEEARALIHGANGGDNVSFTPESHNEPVLCAGMVTVKRKKVQYLNDTLGSMLVGLTPEERSALDVRLLFADVDPYVHPNWYEPWLNLLDFWGTYNVSKEQLKELKEYSEGAKIRRKAVFDYIYILEQCYNDTTAPYIAVFEDDIVFAEGWLSKTLSALTEIRAKIDPWLYLRLFYTESQIGWDKGVDTWYTNPIFSYALALFLCYTTALLVRIYCKTRKPDMSHSSHATLTIFTCITIPAFVTLFFMIGLNALIPLDGVTRMDEKGCCTQAFVYPRAQIPYLTAMLRDVKPDQTDLLIEDWANEVGLARYALTPQVVQHVGLVSTRGMPKKYTKQVWAYEFEKQNPERLKDEHEWLARWGVWRTEDDGFPRT